ncbi:hypothetical protein [Nocardia africana]|uniref:Uncharacterized protein n=1 Tax=Nocardia africana TaxID=134964 RepID=A0A379X5L7_9NOCA|nr:hypothetical protein [Nocardia africana]MCC3318473.1 hypothetical protein [Nocardia africana]SUH71985.1 Uncharacterised protein [Nocardia africana]
MTADPDAGGGEEAAETPGGQGAARTAETDRARQYSTGKLTASQAKTVNAWRGELHRPRRRTYLTDDGRPPASSSDCLAAAVIDLLDAAPPTPTEVARYAARIRSAQRDGRPDRFPGDTHVTFYLPELYAGPAESLLIDARAAHSAAIDDARTAARRRFPGRYQAEERSQFMLGTLADQQLTPTVPRRLPMGTLARMAIDRWAPRAPRAVVAAAAKHSATYHLQHHRARTDMGRQ